MFIKVEGASSHTHIRLQKLYKHYNSWKVGGAGMATPAPTYSYPHVRNKTLTCHIMLSALGTHCSVLWPCVPSHFIVNLDLTLISKFEKDKNSLAIVIAVAAAKAAHVAEGEARATAVYHFVLNSVRAPVP